ncbi:unnamed protein product [Mesocestoides corti]|uniref:JMY domain-containing protein n=1 Tax=Mesocestoides corti TaxID=53468 RepID=A0A0R3UG74_MESCO|nr:unnamed protein product [Mesocestoides corti]
MKADFSIESVDCLIDLPNDYETYPSAWQTLLVKLRNAVLRAFSSTLSARELRAKELLESQKEGNWDFMEYYFCQEEIVSLYCCLSMYEEALDYMDRVESCLTSELAMAAENGS